VSDLIAESAVVGDALIKPAFTALDGLTIRYATSPKAGAQTVVLLSPWPESIYAFLPTWPPLAEQFSLVAFDLPGFGVAQQPCATPAMSGRK
jgi:pimeloyl-ACP methyl ester carboxylesterase